MGLFGKKKENEPCCCGGKCDETAAETNAVDQTKGIKVLGSGCSKCNALEEATKEALADLGMEETIAHVRDFAEIASYGVMSTPALVIDGQVVSTGKLRNKEEVKALILNVRGN